MHPMTPIGQISATGTGEVRDQDGNLVTHDDGNEVAAQQEKDEH